MHRPKDADHSYEGLIRSLEYFGGVPKEVLVDNQKSAMLEHRSGGPRFNERFLDLAAHCGFTPRACGPHQARTKGHFFVRYRSFESWEHLNQLAERWLAEEADPRLHWTLKEEVIERFARKALALGELPPQPYDSSY